MQAERKPTLEDWKDPDIDNMFLTEGWDPSDAVYGAPEHEDSDDEADLDGLWRPSATNAMQDMEESINRMNGKDWDN